MNSVSDVCQGPKPEELTARMTQLLAVRDTYKTTLTICYMRRVRSLYQCGWNSYSYGDRIISDEIVKFTAAIFAILKQG